MRPRTMASPLTLLSCLAVTASLLSAATASTGSVATRPVAAAMAGRTLADRIDVPRTTRQIVTVTSADWGSTHAWLRAWRRTPDGWGQVGDKIRVRLGYGGWVAADNRVQSTGTTPAGRFRMPYAFGRLADPGTDLAYRRFDRNDWWPYDPKDPGTYNVYQRHRSDRARWRTDEAEHLIDYAGQYAYAVVVGFNLPSGVHYSERRRQWVAEDRADTGRGGGIFLHVHGDGLTAGCVSMRKDQMRWLLRWLRPGADSRVVMGPRAYVTRL